MLNLNDDEQGWLDEYRSQLQDRFPGLVENIFIYGPYARGVSDPDIDMRVLVLIREGDREKKDEISHLGYDIDTSGFFAAPLIGVYTKREWSECKNIDSPIYKRIASEGISVP